MTPRLGIDPGSADNAAAALVCGREVLGWWAWRRRKSGAYHMTNQDGATETVPHPANVVEIALDDMWAHSWIPVIVEGAYLTRRHRAKAVSTIKLAEATGEIIAAIRPIASSIERPTYQTWVRDVLGLDTGLGRALLDEAVVYNAEHRLTWAGDPKHRHGLSMGLRVSVCEAALMGVWPDALVGEKP